MQRLQDSLDCLFVQPGGDYITLFALLLLLKKLVAEGMGKRELEASSQKYSWWWQESVLPDRYALLCSICQHQEGACLTVCVTVSAFCHHSANSLSE